jgi:hypothetical protein
MTERSQIYYNVWCCAYRRRHEAKLVQDWELYDREHQTILMCLKIARWIVFDSQKPKHLN